MKHVFGIIQFYFLILTTINAQVIDTSFWDVNNQVNSILKKGDSLFIGGAFNFTGPVTGAAVPFSKNNGEKLSSFTKFERTVQSICPGKSNDWYIGGYHDTTINLCNDFIPFLTHLNSDFTVDSGFNFNFSGTYNFNGISSLGIMNNILYVGGDFQSVNGIPRKNLAAINLGSQLLLPWNPDPNGKIYCLSVKGNSLYVGGDFDSISGIPNKALALYDTTLNLIPLPINSNINSVTTICSTDSFLVAAVVIDTLINFSTIIGLHKLFKFDNQSGQLVSQHSLVGGYDKVIYTLIVTGDSLFIGGNFGLFDGIPRNGFALINIQNDSLFAVDPLVFDTLDNVIINSFFILDNHLYVGGLFSNFEGHQKSNLVSLDLNTGQPDLWNPGTGNMVNVISCFDTIIYVGGSFHIANGKRRDCIAAFNIVTKELLPWNPSFKEIYYSNQPSIECMLISDNRIYVGGLFNLVNGQARNNIASIKLDSNIVLNWNPDVSQRVECLEAFNNDIYFGGIFDSAGGFLRTGLASSNKLTGIVTNWNPHPAKTLFGYYPDIYCLKVFNNVLYAGGSFDSIGGQKRGSIAALDPFSGNALSWEPLDSSNIGDVKSMDICNNNLVIGADINLVNSQSRSGVALLDLTSGAVGNWNLNLNLPNFVSIEQLVVKDSLIYFVGEIVQLPGFYYTIFFATDTVIGIPTPGYILDQTTCNKAFSVLPENNRVYIGGDFSNGTQAIKNQPLYFIVYSTPSNINSAVPEINFLKTNAYPNPFSNSTKLEVEESRTINFPLKLSLYNLLGKEVRSISEITSNEIEIQKQNLSAGTYIYKLSGKSGNYQSGLLVIE
jgi:hypothetical protein